LAFSAVWWALRANPDDLGRLQPRAHGHVAD
jgi:hypothetical protein